MEIMDKRFRHKDINKSIAHNVYKIYINKFNKLELSRQLSMDLDKFEDNFCVIKIQ